ncbi:MAG: SMR family transporter [Lachnospiraceae bacterium]|nr:SMR family transporter [Lachnospiraceae bacterium]
MGNIILIIISVLLNCSAQLAMKKGMMGVGEISGGLSSLISAVPSMITNWFLWISMLCYGVSIVIWMIVLSKVDVSYAYPFLSIGYVISAVVGYYFFAENITPIRVAGIFVICIGVILISRS